MKYSLIFIMALLAGCASTSTDTTQQKPATSKTKVTSKTTIETETKDTNVIFINSFSGFSDDARVAKNVQQECHAIAATLSDAVVKYSAQQRLTVKANPDVVTEQSGKVIKVSITDMYSGGNAFIGHRKSASVKAELFQDGKLINTAEYTRNSAGGVLGGFKGSCSVLEHTVNTLGNDVAKWLKTQQG